MIELERVYTLSEACHGFRRLCLFRPDVTPIGSNALTLLGHGSRHASSLCCLWTVGLEALHAILHFDSFLIELSDIHRNRALNYTHSLVDHEFGNFDFNDSCCLDVHL
jgi:hypothetical protein